MNLGSLGQHGIDRYGQYDAIWFEGRWYTNVEMELESNRLANALQSLGVKKGDRVAIQMPNSPVVLWSFSSIYKIGAVAVPMNPLLRPDQSSYIFQNSGATAVITSPEYAPWVEAAQKQAPDLRHIIVTEKDDIPGTLGYSKLVSAQSTKFRIVETDNDDLAALVYTAGTTGPSKGVMHTHFSLYMTAHGFLDFGERYVGVTLESRSKRTNLKTLKQVEIDYRVSGFNQRQLGLFSLPLSHSYGISVALTGLLAAGRGIVLKWFNVEQALKLIQEFRVTNFMGVPAMYIMLLNHPDFDKYDLSSLEQCGCGSAPLPPEIAKLWREKTGCHLREGWGMTETGATTCANTPNRPPKYGSIGECMIKTDTMKIFNDQDKEVPAGQTGEIVIKGATIMKGYWNMSEETAEVMRNGWLHTGDIGHMDEDGYFYITDRKKDIIIRGGENVSPREVEEVLLQIPQIFEVGIIGIPDKVYQEEIKAFIILRKDAVISGEDIKSFCKQKLPTYKVPKVIEFVETLPKNLMGKIQRAELRKMEKEKNV